MKLVYSFLILLAVTSCKNETATTSSSTTTAPSVVTSTADYDSYLDLDDSNYIAALRADIDSLESLVAVNGTGVLDLGRLASKLNELYDLKANVKDLNRAVKMREAVVANMYVNPAGSKRALAQSYIKQHRFKKADSLMKSFATGKLSAESQMVYFDIAMELGDYDRARKMLDTLTSSNDYNYLIRAAKWNDHKGDLSATIRLMETAKDLADKSGSPALQLWSNSNIADYYGHDGQIQNSYDHYLKTLKQDPSNTYALKGIAWIVYSHEKNPEEALRILNKIKERHPLPDYDLAIAEIKEYQNDTDSAAKLKNAFLTEVSNPAYGAMYNTYKIEQLLGGDAAQKKEALVIASNEIKNRSTPETQSLLSYAMLKNGNKEHALKNQEMHVIDKTFEPVAQLHSLEILMDNGKNKEALTYTSDLSGAAYELGPVTMKNYFELISKI